MICRFRKFFFFFLFLFSLSFFPVSASDFQDVFFDDSSSQLVVYFDLEAHKDLEAAVAFSLPLTYSGLYSDSTPSNSQENWVLEYPFVQTSSVLLSGANFTKRYKLILSYSTLSFSDLDSSWIAFLRNSQLRENISLSLLEYNQSGGLLDSSLPFGIFRTCSFETGEAHSCSETLPFEVSANTSYSIRLPLFLNASKVASLTNVSFEFSPPSSSGLSGDLGSTHLRTLELRYPDDLLIYHSNKLTVLAPANLSFPLWQSASSLYGLKSFTEGNFSGTPASLLYVTDTGVWIDNTSVSSKINSQTGSFLSRSDVYASFSLYNYSLDPIFDTEELNLTRSLKYLLNSSWGIPANSSCALLVDANVFGSPSYLTVNLSGSLYNISSGSVVSNVFGANSLYESGRDMVLVLGSDTLTYENPISQYLAKVCEVRIGAGAYSGALSHSIFMDVGNFSYLLNTSNIDPLSLAVYNFSSYSVVEGIEKLGPLGKNVTFNTTGLVNGSLCNFELGVNSYGEKRPLFLSASDGDHLLDTQVVNTSTYVNFKPFSNSLLGGGDVLSLSNGDIKYYSSLSSLDSGLCRVQVAANYRGAIGSLNLSLESKTQTHFFNLSSLVTDSEENSEFAGSDWVPDSFFPIGKTNGVQADSLLMRTLNLYDDLENYSACYLRMNLCYNGSQEHNLDVFVSSTDFYVNSSELSSCSAFQDYYLEMNCSLLDQNPDVFFSCVDCDASNYFALASDNASGGISNSIFDKGDGNSVYSSSTHLDPLVSVYTNESLAYDILALNLSCSELEETNLTFSCVSCNSSESLQLIADAGVGQSYQQNLLLDSDVKFGVETYENFHYSLLRDSLSCSLLEDPTLTLVCPTCDSEHYFGFPVFNTSLSNLAVFNGTSTSWRNESVFFKVYAFDDVQDSFLSATLNCSDLENKSLSFSCPNCTDEDSYVFFVDQNSSFPLTLGTDGISGNLYYDVISNTSLDYSTLVLSGLSCSLFNNSLLFTCPSCDDENYFNLLKENGSSSHSLIVEGANESLVSDGDLRVQVREYTKYGGDEYALINSAGLLQVFSTNSSLLWQKSLGGFLHRELYVDDFLSDFPGDEFFFANQSVMNVYSSQGTELKQLSGFFYPHMIASDNFLFVLNDGLKYQIYNKYFQLVKTDWLHDAGTEVLKLLEGNVISSTPEDEFVLVTRDYTSTYFVVLDKDFSVLYTYNYSGLVDDVVFNPQFNDSLVLSNSTNITVYPLSPIRNLDFYLNNSLIYSSNEYITSTKKVSGLLGYFVSYINSLTYLGNTSVDIPLSFDFVGDLSSILASFSLDFELNSSPLVQIEAYSGLASTSYLKAGTSYYTSGSKLRYNTSLIPFKITDVSGLLSYFGGPYSLYNERGILEGSCSDSSGSVANLGSVGENGVNIGCGLGYYVTSNRTYDFLMYGNSSVPLIASGASFSSSSLKDTRSSTLSVNASYSGLNFTNVYFKLTSLNTSDYGNFSLEVSNGSLSQTLDVGVQRDNCFYDAYLNGVDDILSSYYVANSFAGRTVYVCMQSLGSGLFDYHIVFSGLTYPNTFTLASVGLKDSPASVANIVSNVSSVSWGSNFSISGNYSDLGGDFVNLTLQFLNPSTSLWENYSTQALLSSNGNFSFDGVNLNSSFVSEQLYYRFLIQDIDNVSLSLKSESYSSLNELELSERQLDLSYLSGGDFSTALSVQVFDNLSFGALSGALCKFYFNNNGSYVLQTVSLSNSSGVCSFSLPSSYAAGDYYFYVVASLDGYLSLQSSVFTKTYKKNLSLLLDYDHALNRSSLLNISARLVDTDSNLVFDSGVSCLLYINDIFVASRSTNASGACDFSNVAFGCGYSVGIHNISFNVSGADSGKYFNPAFEVRDTVALQDVLSLELLSPNNSVSYDPLDVLNLSANVSDSCGNALSANNDFYWEYEELDSGDKSIISSKLHDTWIVPSDVYGSILLRAVYQNASYGVQLENSTLLTVQDVLNIAYLGSDTFLRLPGQVTNLDAQIVTGNGIYVNESSYEGNWSGYNCSWGIYDNASSFVFLGDSVTDSTGHCSFSFGTNCSFSLEDYSLEVNLSGNVTPEYPIFGNSVSEDVYMYDDLSSLNSSFIIDNLSLTNTTDILFYGQEYSYSYNLTDSCSQPVENLSGVNWKYVSLTENVSITLGNDTTITLIPNSLMKGTSQIQALLSGSKYYSSASVSENVTIGRVANLVSFSTPEYLLPNANNLLSCQVLISGLNNLSFYNVTFAIDNITLGSVALTSNGLGTYLFNTTGYSEGVHVLSCSLDDFISSSYYVVAGVNASLNSSSILPSSLSIYDSKTFLGNREYDLSKSSVGNPVYPTGMTYNKVFRNSYYPMYEPEILYLGIGFATIGAVGTIYEGQQILLDGVNVTAYFYENDSDLLVDTLSCVQDTDEFASRSAIDPKDVIDEYYRDYACLLQWDPGNISVGVYKVIINATVENQSGWTSENYTDYFEVWGVANLSLTFPSLGDRLNANGTYDLKSSVYDELGNLLTSDDVNVTYFLRDGSEACVGSKIATVSQTGDPEFTLANVDLDTLNSGAILASDNLDDSWRIQAEAEAEYYETLDLWTSYYPNPMPICTSFYLQRLFYDEHSIYFDYSSEAKFLYPTGSVIAPDTSGDHVGYLSFACKALTYNGTFVRFVPINLTCSGCAALPEPLEEETDYSGIAYFYVSPNSSDTNKAFNFTCSLPANFSLDHGNAIQNFSSDTVEVILVDELGSGWGNLSENFTFPTVIVKSYEDSSCTVERTWFQRGGSSPYIGFTVQKGSDDLLSYTLTKKQGAGSGFIDESTLNSDNDSKCIAYTTGTGALNSVELYTFELIVKDVNSVELKKELSFKMDDVAPVISNASFDKDIYAASDSASLSLVLDPSSINILGYSDIDVVHVKELPVGSWIDLSKISEGNWTQTLSTPVAGGAYQYELEVIDLAGFNDSVTLNLSVDVLDPVIDYFNLSTGCGDGFDTVLGYNCRPTVDFVINASDDSRLQSVKITGTGGIGTLLNATSLNSQLYYNNISVDLYSLSDGNYTINYDVYDYVNHTTHQSLILTIKKTGPSLSSLLVDKNYVSSVSDVLTFTGTVSQDSPFTVASLNIDSYSLCTNQTVCNVNFNSYDLSNFTEGTNILSALALDNLGNNKSKNFSIILDTIPPNVSVSLPLTGSYIKGTFTAKALVQDANRNNSHVSYVFGSCSGSMMFTAGDSFENSSISSSLCTGDGNFTLTVNATDFAGNENSSSVLVVVDNTLPVFSILHPLENESIGSDSYDIEVQVTDVNHNYSQYWIDSDSSLSLSCSPLSATVQNCTASVSMLSLSDGAHVLHVSSVDLAGNSNQTTVSFELDRNPPDVNWTKLVNGDGTLYTSSFANRSVSGAISIYAEIVDEGGNGVPLSYGCYIDSTFISVMNHSVGNEYYCILNTSSYTGSTYFEVRANDTGDRQGVEGYNLTVDNIAPSFASLNLSPLLVKTGDSFFLSLSTDESLKDNCLVYYSIAGVTAVTPALASFATGGSSFCSGSFALTQGTGTSGTRYLLINITDSAGNENFTSVSFELDNTAPIISISSPSNGELIGGEAYEVSVLVTETNLNYSSFWIDSDSSSNLSCDLGAPHNCTGEINSSLYSDGAHVLHVYAQDLVGNSHSVTQNFTVDAYPPEITLLHVDLEDGTQYTSSFNGSKIGGLTSLYAEIVDVAGNGDPSTYKCFVDGLFAENMSLVSGETYVCVLNTSLYVEGNHSFEILANDSSGWNSSLFVSLIVDNIAPDFLGVTLLPSLVKTGDSMFLNLSANENLKGNCEVFYSLNGTSYDTFLENLSLNSSSLCTGFFSMSGGTGSSGNRSILVRIQDEVGNFNTSATEFELDNAIPLLSIITPTGGDVIGGISEISSQVIEKNLYYVRYSLNGSSNWQNVSCVGSSPLYDCNVSVDTTGYPDGVYQLDMEAFDLVNHSSGLVSENIKIDNQPPQISLEKIVNSDGTEYLSSLNGSYVSGNVSIYANISDLAGNGNVSSYVCQINGVYKTNMVDLGSERYLCTVSSLGYASLTNFTIVAQDYVPLQSSETVELFVDNVPPSLENLTLSPLLIKTNNSMNVSLNASETLKGECDIYYSVDGVLPSGLVLDQFLVSSDLCSGTFIMDRDANASGYRYILINFTDLAGNSNMTNLTFYLDNEAPQIVNFNITNAFSPRPETLNLPSISPSKFGIWEANVSENSLVAGGNISEIYLHVVASNASYNPSVQSNFTAQVGDFYNVSASALSFNASNGTTVFQLTAIDALGNVALRNVTLYVTNEPPMVSEVEAVPSSLEVNLASTTITLNLTATGEFLKYLNVSVLSPNGSVETFRFEDNASADYNITKEGGLHSFVYTPHEVGVYNISTYIENLAYLSSTDLFVDVFETIGNTSGTLTFVPSTVSITNISYGAPYEFNLSVNLTNVGNATMRDAKVQFSGAGLGVNLSGNYYNCGTVLSGGVCSFDVLVTVESTIGSGSKSLFLISDWLDSDNTRSNFLSKKVDIQVSDTNKLDIVTDSISANTLEQLSSESLGSFFVRNNGNTLLQNISFHVVNGTLLSPALNFTYSPSSLSSLAIDALSEIDLDVVSSQKGNFQGYLSANASCTSSGCSDFMFVNLSVYDKVKQDITSPSNGVVLYRNVYGGTLPVNCSLTSYYDGLDLSLYPVDFFIDEGSGPSLIETKNTSLTGKVTFTLNLTTVEPGNVSLLCKGEDALSSYIRESDYGNYSINLSLKGILNGTFDYQYPSSCIGSLYWYDSHLCHEVNLSASVLDEFSTSVSGVNVTFYSNAVQSGLNEEIGSCLTAFDGTCKFSWNPNVSVQGVYNVSANFTKNSYYDADVLEKNITILGGYSVEINKPIETELYYGTSYSLNLTVKDTAGTDITDSLTYNTTWALYNASGLVSILSLNQSDSFTVNSSFLGSYFLNVTIVSVNGSVSDVNTITILRDSMELSLLGNSNFQIFRESSELGDLLDTQIEVAVFDNVTLSDIVGANVSFKLNNITEIASCFTNSSGACTITWDPSTNLEGGYYNITFSAEKSFYLAKEAQTQNLVQVYVEPKWLTADTYFGELTNSFDVPLSCEIIESYKTVNNPQEIFPVNFSLLTPGQFKTLSVGPSPYVNETQYEWFSPDADNLTVLGANVALLVELTGSAELSLAQSGIPVTDLGLFGYDTLELSFANLSSQLNWSLEGLNSSGSYEELISSTNETFMNYTFSRDKVFDNFKLVFVGSGNVNATLSSLILKETLNDEVISLGSARVLGSEFSGSNAHLRGDFESFTSAQSPGFSVLGSKLSLSGSTLYSYDGVKSLALNFSNLSSAQTQSLVWKTGSDYELGGNTGMFFVLKNPENLSLSTKIILARTGCSYTYDLLNLSSFLVYPQINLSEFFGTCGATTVKNITFEFTNQNSSNLSGAVYLDRIELLQNLNTSNAVAAFDFHPYEDGYYRFSCEISSSSIYVAKIASVEKQVQIIDSSAESGSESNESQLGGADGESATEGAVLSFELNISGGEYIIPQDGLGLLETITLFNKLDEDRIFNISTNAPDLVFVDAYGNAFETLELSGKSRLSGEFSLYLNSSGVLASDKNVTLSVLDVERNEEITVSLLLHIVPLTLSVIAPLNSSKFTDIVPQDHLTFIGDVQFNSSSLYDSLLENFTYQINIKSNDGQNSCVVESYNITNGVVTLVCLAPFGSNDLVQDTLFRVSLGEEE